MRQVHLQRNAVINGTLCFAGTTVPIADNVALAPFMTVQAQQATPALPAPIAPDKTVTVHYNPATNEVDIDVNGVEMHVADAALKVQVD